MNDTNTTAEAAAIRSPPPVAYPVPGARWAAAMAKAQGQFSNIGKDRDVEVKSEKGRYTFRYATLAAIWDVVRKPLADNGLAVVQLPNVVLASPQRQATVELETRIIHASGEELRAWLQMPLNKVDPQGIGGVISYAKRYHLTALLGLASEDESDVDDHDGPQYAGPRAPPSPAARPSPPAAPANHVELGLALSKAETLLELQAVAARISRTKGLSADALASLRELHAKRQAELKPAPVEPGSEG